MENQNMTNPGSGVHDLALQVRRTISLLNDCSEQMREAQTALTECLKRRDSAEAMLRSLKFIQHGNGVWVNTEL
jgi:hypothetical protein